MSKKIFALAATAALAGCLSFPETTTQLRTTPGVVADQYLVSRSASSVVSTLAERGRACMTYGQQTQITRIGGSPGAGMNAIFRDSFRTRTEQAGNVRSFVIEHYSPNNVGNPGWYPRIVADVAPAGSGSQVTVYAPVGSGQHTKAIKAWANGDLSPCPGKS